MSRKYTYIVLRFIGVCIMLMAFLVISDSKPWYYEVLLFDIGLIISIIPKFPKLKKRFIKIRAKL